MITSPFFTVGLPTFNRAASYLPHTLGMLLRQRFDDFEILVSDNAAEDETATVVAGFKDPRIRYVRRPIRLSPGEHFATIANEARGRFFVLNQDDDLLHLDFLARAHRSLEETPQAVMYACPIWREQPQRGYSSIALRPHEGYCDENVVSDLPYLIEGPYAAAKFFDLKLHFVHPAIAISRKVLGDVGGYDTGSGYSVDLITQARVLLRGPLVYDPRPGGIFRVHVGNYSRTMDKAFRKQFFRETYNRLILAFGEVECNWKVELDRYLATLGFDELLEIVHEWLYYRTCSPLQDLGMLALARAWPGSSLALWRKLGSKLGWRNLARYGTGKIVHSGSAGA